MAAVVGVGFVATLGVIGARSAHKPPAAAAAAAAAAEPVTPALTSVAVTAFAPRAAEGAASDLKPEPRNSAAALPAPTYDEVTALRDRAAARGARSR